MTKAFDAKTKTRIEIERVLREKELVQFNQVLAQSGARLIVVSGETDAGKSSLLQVFQFAALEKGRRVAPDDPRGALRVSAETSEESFTGDVAALLGIPPGDLTGVWEGPRIELPAEPLQQSRPRYTPADVRSGNLAPTDSVPRSGKQPGGSLAESHRRFHPLIERIQSRSEKTGETPILLLIDEYDPSKDFDAWFGGRFLAELRKSRAMMMVVVAGEPDKVHGLVSHADLHLNLDPPDAGFVRQALDRMGGGITPRMELAEMEMYVKEIIAQPKLLRHLLRVLLLCKAERN